MNEADWMKKFRELNEKLYSEAKNPLRSHGPEHHERVCHYSLKLADTIGRPVQRDVLIAASFLHDLSAYYPEQVGDNYHTTDAPLAQQVLGDTDFPPEKIPLVLEAIAKHGSDPKFRLADEAIEVTILRDADKLDVFGPLGVARIIMVRTLKGDTLAQIVIDFYGNGHLQRKYDSITLPQAKELARPGFEYSRDFFQKLAASINQPLT